MPPEDLHAALVGLTAEVRSLSAHVERISTRFYAAAEAHATLHRREEAESRKRGQAMEQRITRAESSLQARSFIGAVGLILSWIAGPHLPFGGPGKP